LSVRNVRSEMRARDLAGASGACVILSVLAAFKVNATRPPPCAGFRVSDDQEFIPSGGHWK
jgi:hypothetical protein